MIRAGTRTLLIDNYDSFTINLYQLIAEINGVPPTVVRNDQVTWEAIAAHAFDNIVISPGPGRPENPADFGVCLEAIVRAEVPVLGVCLGHQGIGLAYGGSVVHAPTPMHGRLSEVYHDDSPLFAGIPQGFQVVRYHSFVVDEDLPKCLNSIAWTREGLVMGIAHESLPRWGVQFHPESIATEHGARILRNFRDLTRASPRRPHGATPSLPSIVREAPKREVMPEDLVLRVRRVPLADDPERVFWNLYRDDPVAFWLDSSRVERGLSRFSFMGAGGGPHSLLATYDDERGEVTVVGADGRSTTRESIYELLARELARRRRCSDELPFELDCGFVGYFGYELEAELGARARHRADTPGAIFLLADRLLAFDHEQGELYLLCLAAPGEDAASDAWLDATERRLTDLAPPPPLVPTHEPVELRLDRSRRTYLDDIERCRRLIRDGESYELCLTNQIHASPIRDPLAFYRVLRRVNPAPYAAYLRFDELAIMSSSPERFLRLDRTRWVESKPIKGTRPRGATPAADEALRRELHECEKDRAENLMIVDLLRNDLGLVCEVGSVHVPAMMQVETYETVHQLVSTIRGRVRPGIDAVECVRAAFPGGSMTGAPKRRTMELLDELETSARGVYSGAIGFFGLGGGAELGIVIRTVVSAAASTTIGVGGAIVALSDPETEFDETLVKARALIGALLESARGPRAEQIREDVLAALREHGLATL